MKGPNTHKIVSLDSQRIKTKVFIFASCTNRSYSGTVIESLSTKMRH